MVLNSKESIANFINVLLGVNIIFIIIACLSVYLQKPDLALGMLVLIILVAAVIFYIYKTKSRVVSVLMALPYIFFLAYVLAYSSVVSIADLFIVLLACIPFVIAYLCFRYHSIGE